MYFWQSSVAVAGLLSVATAFTIQKPIAKTDDDDDGIPLPLLIWHGLGDNFQAEGLRSVGKIADEVNPGTYVYYIHLADDSSRDQQATFFGNLTQQIDQVCEALAQDPILSTAPAVNGLGFSQGGQFLRGYIERCNDPPVANLVTFGSQHNGIAKFQECGTWDLLCKSAEYILRSNTWSDYVQNKVVPAQYFRDPEDLDNYLEHSNFLADINNEREHKNELYKANMMDLEKFAMYVFDEDVTVVPKESGWFSEFNQTSEKETKLKDRALYKEDWLGLKYLDEHGKLDFKSTPGPHMSLNREILVDAFKTYFSGKVDLSRKSVSQEL